MSNIKDKDQGNLLSNASSMSSTKPQIAPQDGSLAVPLQAYPPPSNPQQGHPMPDFPQQGYPQQGHPMPDFPQQGYPGTAYPVQQSGSQPFQAAVIDPKSLHNLTYSEVYSAGNPQAPYSQGPQLQGPYPPGFYPADTQPPVPPGFKIPEDTYADQSGGENGEFKAFDFTEKSIRMAFIRKVYGILLCQLLISISFISLFLFHTPTKLWVIRHPTMTYVALGVYFVMAVLMICCGELRRKAPLNYILLSVFTFATSYILGVITSTYNVDTVMIAVGITAAVVLALTLFAFQTKYDFTGLGGFLFCALFILILFGICCAFMPSKTGRLLYAAGGALIFSLYIVYDTQLMLGGNHKYAITPEEYIFAALNLYLDIINLFLKVLYLVGRR